MVGLKILKHIPAVFRRHIGSNDVLHLDDRHLMTPFGQILGSLAAHHTAADYQNALAHLCPALQHKQGFRGPPLASL